MKHTITILLGIWGLVAHGQDTIYLDANRDTVALNALWTKMKVVEYDTTNNGQYQVRCYTSDTTLENIHRYINYPKRTQHGNQEYYHESGGIYFEQVFENNTPNGYLIAYFPNGKMKRKDYFENGEFIHGTIWDSNGVEMTHFPFEVTASFPGGESAMFQFLGQNMQYPSYAKDHNIQGRVYISFIVEKNGEISKVEILRSPHESLSEEAKRVIETMPKWSPALQDNEPIRVRFNLPIVFKLSGGRTSKKKKKKRK